MALQTIQASEKEPFKIATAIRAIIELFNTSRTITSEEGQITFPATQNPSTNVNVLDDYEEGDWTPAFTFATPGDLSITYSLQTGKYIKIGKLVYVRFSLASTVGGITHTTAAGNALVTGLPFTVGSDGQGPLHVSGVTKAGYTMFVSNANATATTVSLLASGSGVTGATIVAADIPTGGTLILISSLSYVADA